MSFKFDRAIPRFCGSVPVRGMFINPNKETTLILDNDGGIVPVISNVLMRKNWFTLVKEPSEEGNVPVIPAKTSKSRKLLRGKEPIADGKVPDKRGIVSNKIESNCGSEAKQEGIVPDKLR